MESAREVLAIGVLNSRDFFKRYLAGFDERTLVAQPPGLPNHLAWTLGHLALIMSRAAEKLGLPTSVAVPEDQFVTGSGRAGGRGGAHGAGRFDTASVCFGSTPFPDADLYPDLARCVEIFDAACERLARQVRECPQEALERQITWGAGSMPGWQLVTRMLIHNGTHAGELADIRRALGFKSIFS